MYLPLHMLLGLFLLMFHASLCIRTSKDLPARFIANKNCRLIISEINVYPAGGGQFIELQRVCTPSPKNVFNVVMGEKYKLAFIDHSGYLVGVCTLKNIAHRRTGEYIFYVVGGLAVENAEMRLSECEFAQDADYYSENLMPYADKAPVAVALVYHRKGKLKWLEMKKDGLRTLKVPITKTMESLMTQNIVDMYVYTTSSPYTGCDHFATYYEGYKSENQVVLRDWAQTETDLSLSRCNPTDVQKEADWNPMQPAYFVYAPKSPGDVNKCSKGNRFRIEDTQRPRIPPLIHYRTTPEYSCYITTVDPHIDNAHLITSPSTYRGFLKEIFPGNVEDTCIVGTEAAVSNGVLNDVPPTAPRPIEQNKFEEGLEKSIPHIWSTCDNFPSKDWISELRAEKNPYLRAEDVLRQDVCYWIDYIVPQQFQCRLCRVLWNQEIIFDRPGSHQLRAVKKPQRFLLGASKNTKYKNRDLLMDHMDTTIHKLGMDYIELFDAGLRGKALNEEFYRDGGPMRSYLEPTEKEFVAVYQSNRLDIPFYKHPLMARLLTFYGVNIGFLFQNPNGAKMITMSISKTLHKDFVQDLLNRRPDISVLIDTATDVSSISSLAILLQTFDKDGKVVVVLYRLMKSGMSEGGEELFTMFTNALQEDGLLDYVREKLIGFASDGGSNVKKFRRLLTTWTGRDDLYLVHCFAHKLDLVLKHSWTALAYFEDIDHLVNSLYRLFNSKSHKKKELLQNTARELEDSKFELKRIIPTRWVSSRLQALRIVLRHWKTLVKAVEYVLADRSLKPNQRANINLMRSELKDPTVMATMAFITDTCEELSLLSLHFQGRGLTLITKKERRTKLTESLVKLKSTNGKWLQWIVDNAVHVTQRRAVVSIQEFETNKVSLDGVEMEFDEEENDFCLHSEREGYIDAVLEEIDEYFPKDATDYLEIFDASKWTTENIVNFGNTEILGANLGLKWKLPPPRVLQDWIDLKSGVLKNADFRRLVKKTPEEFWTYFLTEGSGVAWPDTMKTVITNLLVVPASTAEVERIFSIYNNVKTVKRYSLDVTTVEAIVRIKFNGPKDLEDFDAPRFVKNFILEGHSRTDDSSSKRKKRPRSDESQCEESESSEQIDTVMDTEAACTQEASEDDSDNESFLPDDETVLTSSLFTADEVGQPMDNGENVSDSEFDEYE